MQMRQEDELGNRISLITLVLEMILIFFTLIARLAGFFYIDFSIPWLIGELVLVVAVLVAIFLYRDLMAKVWFKYILLLLHYYGVIGWCSFCYLHSQVIIILPLLLCFCYHSVRFDIATVLCSLVSVFVTPFLAYYTNGFEEGYAGWLVNLSGKYPEYTSHFTSQFMDMPIDTKILLWVVLPLLLTTFAVFILVLVNSYFQNRSYQKQIDKILSMQESVVASMAQIIENRDASTGGHVKRTQDVVRLLVKYLKEEIHKPESYWDCVIKAAPMHDLGKISVSDTILLKPGKLTPEEFKEIKKHPNKSAEIIDTVMKDVIDPELYYVAMNLARFHHEKYDGTGYPQGRTGEGIPLEARIMAVADVFDALVSPRVYKPPMGKEKAFETIEEEFGTHFDPKLKNAFEKAYPEICQLY